MHPFTSRCTHVYIFINTPTHTPTQTYLRSGTSTRICSHNHTLALTQTYTHTHTHPHTHTHTHAHTHTHTHTCTHACTPSHSSSPTHARILVPRPDVCMCCRAREFNTTHRRHHCRQCGDVICSGCAGKARPPWHTPTDRSELVCKRCTKVWATEDKSKGIYTSQTCVTAIGPFELWRAMQRVGTDCR